MGGALIAGTMDGTELMDGAHGALYLRYSERAHLTSVVVLVVIHVITSTYPSG
jgi:hypothetical protein